MTGIATSLLQRAAALVSTLLLALAIASPAVAEIGCSWDAATHFAETEDHADEHGDDAPEPGGPASGGEADRDDHCAFAHGHGSLATAAAGPTPPARVLSFALPPAARFLSSLPPGLDRPPRG